MAHSSPWFSTACAGAIAHRSHLFHLYSQNDFSASKLAYASKIKESVYHSPKNWLTLVLVNLNSVLNKNKSALLLVFDVPEMLSSASDKAKLLAENFFKKYNLHDFGIQRYSQKFFD